MNRITARALVERHETNGKQPWAKRGGKFNDKMPQAVESKENFQNLEYLKPECSFVILSEQIQEQSELALQKISGSQLETVCKILPTLAKSLSVLSEALESVNNLLSTAKKDEAIPTIEETSKPRQPMSELANSMNVRHQKTDSNAEDRINLKKTSSSGYYEFHVPSFCKNLYYGSDSCGDNNSSSPKVSKNRLLRYFPSCIHDYHNLLKTHHDFELCQPNAKGLEQAIEDLELHPFSFVRLEQIQNILLERHIPYHLWAFVPLISVFDLRVQYCIGLVQAMQPKLSWSLLCRHILAIKNPEKDFKDACSTLLSLIPDSDETVAGFYKRWQANAALYIDHLPSEILIEAFQLTLKRYPFQLRTDIAQSSIADSLEILISEGGSIKFLTVAEPS